MTTPDDIIDGAFTWPPKQRRQLVRDCLDAWENVDKWKKIRVTPRMRRKPGWRERRDAEMKNFRQLCRSTFRATHTYLAWIDGAITKEECCRMFLHWQQEDENERIREWVEDGREGNMRWGHFEPPLFVQDPILDDIWRRMRDWLWDPRY
jgi:hypothetical protein